MGGMDPIHEDGSSGATAQQAIFQTRQAKLSQHAFESPAMTILVCSKMRLSCFVAVLSRSVFESCSVTYSQSNSSQHKEDRGKRGSSKERRRKGRTFSAGSSPQLIVPQKLALRASSLQARPTISQEFAIKLVEAAAEQVNKYLIGPGFAIEAGRQLRFTLALQ